MSKSNLLISILGVTLLLSELSLAQSSLERELDSMIPELMTKARIPGLSIVVIENEAITYDKAFGLRSSDHEDKVEKHTIFEAASLTKPVFAYALCQLVDAGQLDLDKPLTEYWRYPDIEYSEWHQLITARMILTHSAGFPNWRRPRTSSKLPLNFKPGDRFSYSGEGFVYLSKVVAHITGTPTHEWVDRLVFDPLGMEHSSLIWESHLGRNSALPHNRSGTVKDKFKPAEANAAASLHTTARDYAKFIIGMIQGQNLSPTLHSMILSPQQNVDPNCSQCRRANSDPKFKGVSWGLGVGLEHTDQDYIWHWGDNGNFKGYFCVLLSTGKGLVYFANSHNGLAIRDQLVSAVLPGEHPAHSWVKYDQVGNNRDNASSNGKKDLLITDPEMIVKRLKEEGITDELALFKMGRKLRKEGRIQAALKVFHYNVEVYPDSWRTWDTLGHAYTITEDKANATKYLTKALELNPENERARHLLEKMKK